MEANEKMRPIGQPVPELPVADIERAQQHYREALGFEIGWLRVGKEIGAVSNGKGKHHPGPDLTPLENLL